MNLKILVPYRLLAERKDVKRIVAQTDAGAFGFLPNRLDCVAVLVPGIFVFEAEGQGESYMAVDEGILIKAGTDVLVSVRNAIEGSDLVTLEHAVEKEFLRGDAQEQSVRQVMSKMESGFIRRFAEFFRE